VDSGHVVHLVGAVTDSVFSFLGPSTAALAEQGFDQTVILVDHPMHRHLLPRFHASIRLELIPLLHTGPLRRATLALHALTNAVKARTTRAVHLHGAIPGLIGAYAARSRVFPSRVYFSPHASRLLGRPGYVSQLSLKLLRATLSSHWPERAIASSSHDAKTLRRITDEPVALLESPVDATFLVEKRHEARRPLIVTAGRERNPKAAALFSQLAVLLSEEPLGASCNWLGTADANSMARMAAADVAVYDATEPADRSSRLSSAWLYVSFDGGHGFPVFLAEAMAIGLPCVVWDTPQHRELIEHGRTGLCCNSQQQMLERIADLIDSPVERQRLGAAAREEARRRFDEHRFRDSLLTAYASAGDDAPPPQRRDAPPRRYLGTDMPQGNELP
jgi:glycosyltransferase involved in cell wall biosynthesis